MVSLTDSLRGLQQSAAEGAEALTASQALATTQGVQLLELSARAVGAEAELQSVRKQVCLVGSRKRKGERVQQGIGVPAAEGAFSAGGRGRN